MRVVEQQAGWTWSQPTSSRSENDVQDAYYRFFLVFTVWLCGATVPPCGFYRQYFEFPLSCLAYFSVFLWKASPFIILVNEVQNTDSIFVVSDLFEISFYAKKCEKYIFLLFSFFGSL